MNRIIFGVFLILTCRPPSAPRAPLADHHQQQQQQQQRPASGYGTAAPGGAGGGIVAVQATPLAQVYSLAGGRQNRTISGGHLLGTGRRRDDPIGGGPAARTNQSANKLCPVPYGVGSHDR
uniref:Uncharacterized protein n=1 Tax=Anopheles merus TaxID=30066 RepID=A0A182VDM8_ANOME